MILRRKTDEVSFAPTQGVLVLRDTTVFKGNGPVSITWPEISIQAQKCWCIPTGKRGIVWAVSVLLSYTKSWYICWTWFQRTCSGESSTAREGGVGRCVTQARCTCIFPGSNRRAQNYFLWDIEKSWTVLRGLLPLWCPFVLRGG